MRKKVWLYSPRKSRKIVDEIVKREIKQTCDAFIESELQPLFVKTFNPCNTKKRQLIKIYCKWIGSFVYFVGVFKDLRPMTHVSEYEEKLARLEYMDKNRLCLAYIRHTGAWHDITHGQGFSLQEALKCIKQMPHFAPIM